MAFFGPRARRDNGDDTIVSLNDDGLDVLSDQLDELLSGAREERAREESLLRTSVESLERSAADLRRQITALADERSVAMTDALGDITAQIHDITRSIEPFASQVSELAARMSALADEIGVRTERQLGTLREQLTAEVLTIAQVEGVVHDAIAPVQDRVHALVSDLASADARTTAEIQDLRRTVAADVAATGRMLAERIEALEDVAGSSAARVDGITSTIAALRADTERIQVIAEAVETGRSETLARINAMQAALHDELARAITATLERMEAAQHESRVEMTGRIESVQEELSGRVASVKGDVERLRMMTQQTIDGLRRVTQEDLERMITRFDAAMASIATTDQLGEVRAEIEYIRTLYGASVEYLKSVFDKLSDDLDVKLNERFEWFSVEDKARADDIETRVIALTDELTKRTNGLARDMASAQSAMASMVNDGRSEVAAAREEIASAREEVAAARSHVDAVVDELRRKVDQGIIETEASVARALGRFQHEESERGARIESSLIGAQQRVQAAVGALEEQFASGIATLEARFTAYIAEREQALAEERARFATMLDEALARADDRQRKGLRKVFGGKKAPVPAAAPTAVELPPAPIEGSFVADEFPPPEAYADLVPEPEPIRLGPVVEEAPRPARARSTKKPAAKKSATKKPAATRHKS